MKKITQYWLSSYLIERSNVLTKIFGLVGIIVFIKIIEFSIEWGSNIWPKLLDSAESQAIIILAVMIFGVIISIFLLYFVRLCINKLLRYPFFYNESKLIIRYANTIHKLKNFINKKNVSIEEVLKYSKIAYGILLKFNQVALTEKNWYQENRKMRKFLEENSKSILDILIELRSKLRKEIAGEKKKLIQAQGDLEKYVTGTSSLNQISKLQSARLDHQIEQFEELQKVLVKI